MMRTILHALVIGLALTGAANADARREATRWIEDFSSGASYTQRPWGNWQTEVTPDGLLVRGTDPQASFQFQFVRSPRFPLIRDTYILDTDIALRVRPDADAAGGAGVILGTRDGHWTTTFTLSPGGQFDIMVFDPDGGQSMASGTHQIDQSGSALLTLVRDGNTLRFAIDGADVFVMDAPELEPQTLYSRPGPQWVETPPPEDLGEPHIIDRFLEPGLAVWGSGDFVFEQLALTPTSAALDSIGMDLPQCGLAEPEPGSRLIHVSLYDTPTLSSLSTAGIDRVTHYAEIDVAPSADKLSLILSSYSPMVWAFNGDTDAIGQVMVVGPAFDENSVASGVTGVAREHITFYPSDKCFPSVSGPDADDADYVREVVAYESGRPADLDVFAYSQARIALPEGAMLEQSQEANALRIENVKVPSELLARANRFNPGGVVGIEADTIVSPRPATAYEILPQEWGLIQLVALGLIEDVTPENDYAFNSRFRIIGPVPRFPAGLNGAHLVTFERPAGIPMPDGSPGHSSVVDIP